MQYRTMCRKVLSAATPGTQRIRDVVDGGWLAPETLQISSIMPRMGSGTHMSDCTCVSANGKCRTQDRVLCPGGDLVPHIGYWKCVEDERVPESGPCCGGDHARGTR